MYQTRFRFSPGKLKSRWIGPYVVLKAYPSGYVDLMTERGSFKVNGHRLKLYNENDPVRNGEARDSLQKQALLRRQPVISQRKLQPDLILTKAKQEPLRVREALSFATRNECDKYFSSSLRFFSAISLPFCNFMASKRASSSRNAQDHPCLSFDSDNILRSEKLSLMIELDRLRKRDVEIGSIVDLHFVEEIGFGDRLSSLLRREYRDHFRVLRFVNNDWEKALKTHEPIYYELVLEFLATFSFDVEAYEEDRIDGPCIRFRLLGEWYEITLPRFGVVTTVSLREKFRLKPKSPENCPKSPYRSEIVRKSYNAKLKIQNHVIWWTFEASTNENKAILVSEPGLVHALTFVERFNHSRSLWT
ncbi:hypothetical protein OSB04_019238 [Centaurea solstitialis]|uniref:Uncharacterized protein n=1 Tax=Centaurea solstitialis TaxID=347529 RepID=A0AA38WC72_9ASTR|nr:hypothetical protein OSB04_019238 [Centaurea solstitialis]